MAQYMSLASQDGAGDAPSMNGLLPHTLGATLGPFAKEGVRALIRYTAENSRDGRLKAGDEFIDRSIDMLEAHLDKLSDEEWLNLKDDWNRVQDSRHHISQRSKEDGTRQRIQRFFYDSDVKKYRKDAEIFYKQGKTLSDFHRSRRMWRTDNEGRRVPLAAADTQLGASPIISTGVDGEGYTTTDRIVATLQIHPDSEHPMNFRVISREYEEIPDKGLIVEILPSRHRTFTSFPVEGVSAADAAGIPDASSVSSSSDIAHALVDPNGDIPLQKLSSSSSNTVPSEELVSARQSSGSQPQVFKQRSAAGNADSVPVHSADSTASHTPPAEQQLYRVERVSTETAGGNDGARSTRRRHKFLRW